METEHISPDSRRLLQACVVLFKIYPRMLRDMISNNVPTEKLDEMIKKAGKNFKKHFNPAQLLILDNIRTDGFTKMDGSLLYKLIRHFELVERPSSGWDNTPKADAIKQGDDVQRLRNLRNSIFHTLTATLTEQENERFFSVFVECGDRLDRYLKRPRMIFSEDIKKVKFLEDSVLHSYDKKFTDTEKMQEEASWEHENHIIKLYYKKTLSEEIENYENKRDGPTLFNVEIIGDEDTVVEILQQSKALLNKRGCKIKVKSVRKGSVVLLVSIGYMAFASILSLQEQMQLFVNRILGITDIRKWMKKDLRILLLPIDFIASTEHDYTIQCEECQVTLKPDAQFCHECGKEIVERQIFCSDCNGAVIEEQNFCPNCGNQLRQDSQKECDMMCIRKNCKTILQPGMNFCHICKWKIDRKSFCPKCNCVIVEENTFCPCCGFELRKDTDAVETTADHNDEHNAHAQNTFKDIHVLATAVDHDDLQAQNAIDKDATTVDHDDVQNLQAQNAIDIDDLATTVHYDDEQNLQAQHDIDIDALATTVDHDDVQNLQAQNAIETESMTEVKRLLAQMYEEGSEMFIKHLNKTLNKWRDEKVKFGLAGQTSTGKSSFINMLTGSTKSNEKRAETSVYGNTTTTTTEYTYTRQRNVSFFDCPGFGTPSFKPQSYFTETGVKDFDYTFIFFNVISILDIQFAQALAKKDMKFCFVRTKLDLDILNAKYDSEENISPDLFASELRKTTEESIQKEHFPKPSVFVISNRVHFIGHLQDLLSHIEQVLHKTKYDAFIYEIAAYTREVIKKKYDFLHERINGISFAAVVDEVEVATDFDFENVDKDEEERKSLNIINWLAKEVMLYIETFELSKKSSLTLIRKEYVRQKLKFAKLLTTDVEKNVTIFIKRKLESKFRTTVKSTELYNKSTRGFITDDKDVQFLQKEYPHLIPSINILSEVLDGLQHDALVLFEEFSKGR